MLWICPLLFPLLGQTPVDFNRDVRPMLVDKCYHCHGPDEENRNSNLRLDSAKGSSRAVRGKTPEDSELHLRISSTDPDIQMPPPDSNIKKKLSIGEIKILKAWLGQGAPYAKHWAYERPTPCQPPPMPNGPNPLIGSSPIGLSRRDCLTVHGRPKNCCSGG